MTMRSRSDNMLQGIEYMNWYQVIRPIGFSVNEKSRFELLKVADESDLRIRDSVPWWLRKRTFPDPMISESDFQKLADSKVSLGRSNEASTAPAASTVEEQEEPKIIQSVRSKEALDENKEIEGIFWELLKSCHPTCPDDIDLQAIRNALAERQAKLGRIKIEPSEEDVFDKYGLGLNARKRPDDNADTSPGSKPPSNELFDMIDKMASERMKPEPKRSDMFDKNKPIKGKVGFRRDEEGKGPRDFTDLDEALSFGDLDKDVDFKKYLVKQNRGRYDSKGNFIPGRFDSKGNFTPGKFDAKGNFIPGIYDDDGNFIEGKYDEKGRFIQGRLDSKGEFIPGRLKVAAEDSRSTAGENTRKSRKKSKKKKGDTDSSSFGTGSKSKSKRGKSLANMTDEERRKYLESLRSSSRHPEMDYPHCNYPKWVHRMYRMDQVKFGQLIKQGTGVPEYTPPWMMDTLDRVWGAKDPKTRGVKPSKDPKLEKSRLREANRMKLSAIRGKTGGSRDGELGKKGSRKEGEGSDENREGGGGDGGGIGAGDGGTGGKSNLRGQTGEEGAQGDGQGKGEGLADDLGGLADFLQSYDKEMVDLARLDAQVGPDKKSKNKDYTSFDIDDLIDQYHDDLLREQNIYKQDRENFHKKEKMEEKAKRIKERQEAALKKIRDKEKALKQQEQVKKEAKEEKETKQNAQREKLLKQKELAKGMHGSTDKLGRPKIGKFRKGKGREYTNKKAPETEPCAEFKASDLAKTREDECMKRFRVLLGGHRSRFFGGTDFLQLAQQISLIRYPPAPAKKTPCELVEVPICR